MIAQRLRFITLLNLFGVLKITGDNTKNGMSDLRPYSYPFNSTWKFLRRFLSSECNICHARSSIIDFLEFQHKDRTVKKKNNGSKKDILNNMEASSTEIQN